MSAAHRVLVMLKWDKAGEGQEFQAGAHIANCEKRNRPRKERDRIRKRKN